MYYIEKNYFMGIILRPCRIIGFWQLFFYMKEEDFLQAASNSDFYFISNNGYNCVIFKVWD